eukprot:scaffold221453_cov19-Tisochrysis_lutea.AAC.2
MQLRRSSSTVAGSVLRKRAIEAQQLKIVAGSGRKLRSRGSSGAGSVLQDNAVEAHRLKWGRKCITFSACTMAHDSKPSGSCHLNCNI